MSARIRRSPQPQHAARDSDEPPLPRRPRPPRRWLLATSGLLLAAWIVYLAYVAYGAWAAR